MSLQSPPDYDKSDSFALWIANRIAYYQEKINYIDDNPYPPSELEQRIANNKIKYYKTCIEELQSCAYGYMHYNSH